MSYFPTVTSVMFQVLRTNVNLLTDYAEDFLFHDVETLAKAPTGSQFVWVIRPMGTHLLPVNENLHDNVCAVKVFSNSDTFAYFLITIENGVSELNTYPRGSASPITHEEACGLAPRELAS